jgi:uncharacterized protein YecE (DUF72 family)
MQPPKTSASFERALTRLLKPEGSARCSYKNTEEDRAYLSQLLDRFKDYPLVVELRHASWNEPAVYQSFERREVGFCNIDQPLFARSIKPSARATSRIGYVRLHDRNYENWFRENAAPSDRYNYLYSLEELEPWVDKVKKIAIESEETFVFTNNHFRGKGVVNALEMKALLEGEKVRGPASLVEEYPRIKESIVVSGQATLLRASRRAAPTRRVSLSEADSGL